jgi:nucleoside phosphorylase
VAPTKPPASKAGRVGPAPDGAKTKPASKAGRAGLAADGAKTKPVNKAGRVGLAVDGAKTKPANKAGRVGLAPDGAKTKPATEIASEALQSYPFAPLPIYKKSALRVDPTTWAASISLQELYQIWFAYKEVVNYWFGQVTEERLLITADSMPRFRECFDLAELRRRLGLKTISILAIIPEIQELNETVVAAILNSPTNGVQRAEGWLLALAESAAADMDVEAATYLSSRGKLSSVIVDRIAEAWKHAAARNVSRSIPTAEPGPHEGREELTLSEIAERSKEIRVGWRFMSFYDAEEPFVEAAMLRAFEHLDLGAFEPWAKAAVQELSDGPVDGIDPSHASMWLFGMARTDYAIATADPEGVRFWLRSLSRGSVHRDRPWRSYDGTDSFVFAAELAFASWRFGEVGTKVRDGAMALLLGSQSSDGSWRWSSNASAPSVFATCCAIHALASIRPLGWKASVARAASWLSKQQDEFGYWKDETRLLVYVTVLAMDSLQLAYGRTPLTFGKTPGPRANAPGSVEDEQTYDASGSAWHNPALPRFRDVRFANARAARPRVALVVATDTELRQGLRIMQPLSSRGAVMRVVRGANTYYVGRVGFYTCVLVMSDMGSGGQGGSALVTADLISAWKPRFIICAGIAFGVDRARHRVADVLVARLLVPYDLAREGSSKVIWRDAIPPAGPVLVNRFRNAVGWSFERPDGSVCNTHAGKLLSGSKLIDSARFKQGLLRQQPEAIGGEMEGSGVWAAAARTGVEWIVVKGVCDWADGRKHSGHHEMAAASAFSLCESVLSVPGSLDDA